MSNRLFACLTKDQTHKKYRDFQLHCHTFFSQMAFNNIPQLLKSHFENCPLSGDILFNNNDIGYIEDGTFDHVTIMTRL